MSATQQQLQDVVLDELTSIAKRKKLDITVTEETKLKDVVSETDGKKSSNTKNIFRIAFGWTLNNVNIKRRWPADWMNMSVKDLATWFVTMLIIALTCLPAQSQVQVTIGGGKTPLKDAAITFGVRYLKNLDSLFGGTDFVSYGKRSGFLITPDADIRLGSADAFSSIAVKATGLLMTFETKTVAGLLTPDLDRTFHTFPFSAGVETNQHFTAVNLVASAGWVPWFKSSAITPHVDAGVFLEAGYKFEAADSARNITGGTVDHSEEEPNSFILRSKASLTLDTKDALKVGSIKFGIAGNGLAWYDIANGAFYYSIDARARMYLAPDNFIEFVLQKNAVAPNFTEGRMLFVAYTKTF